MSTKGQHQNIALDIERFASVNEALVEAGSLTTLLTGLAQRAVMEENTRGGYDLIHAFLLSSVARARGIADGITREIQHDNTHAVFALLRPLLEIGGLIEYVHHHNAYAAVLEAYMSVQLCEGLWIVPNELTAGGSRR